MAGCFPKLMLKGERKIPPRGDFSLWWPINGVIFNEEERWRVQGFSLSVSFFLRLFTSTLLKPRHSVLCLKVNLLSMLSFFKVPSPCTHARIGEKFLARWYRGYLIAVSLGGRVVGGRAALTSSQSSASETMTLTIYDIQNQFVGKEEITDRGIQIYFMFKEEIAKRDSKVSFWLFYPICWVLDFEARTNLLIVQCW